MNKKIALGLLALALLCAAIVPATVSAASLRPTVSKLQVVMKVGSIDQSVISTADWPQANPANSNSWAIVDMVENVPAITGWVVANRSIYGKVSGDLIGDFIFTYGGIVNTLQSGSIQGIVNLKSAKGAVYLAARGELETNIAEIYTFPEIVGWCQMAGIPVNMFFAAIYNNPQLAQLPEDVLAGMYGTQLPPLPKTLTANFTGTARIDAGTGAYGDIHGVGRFMPYNNKPLLLGVYPNQHVTSIEGSILLNEYRSTTSSPQLWQMDKSKIDETINKFKDLIRNRGK